MADERQPSEQSGEPHRALRLEALRYLTQAVDEAGNELRPLWWSKEDPDLASLRDSDRPEWQLLSARSERMDKDEPEEPKPGLLERGLRLRRRRPPETREREALAQRSSGQRPRLSGVPEPPWEGRIAEWARALLALLVVVIVVVGTIKIGGGWGILGVVGLVVFWYLARLAGTIRRERHLSRILDPAKPSRRKRPARPPRRDPAKTRIAADVQQARRLQRANDLAGAEAAWGHAAAARRPGAELGLGRVLQERKDLKRAEAAFRRASELARAQGDKTRFEAAQKALRGLGVKPEPPLQAEEGDH